MKKSIFTLVALGVAALLYSAAAQTSPVAQDDNNTNAATDENAPPPDPGNAAAAPADAGAAMPDMGAMMPDQSAPGDNAPRTPTVILPSRRLGLEDNTLRPSFLPPGGTGTNSNAIMLNFVNTPLEMVLSYLSDAAGFIIVLETPVRGNVSVISKHPITKHEAVDLLNSVLNQNGYAAIQGEDGRTLTIVDKNDAKTRNIPVVIGEDPANIPNNAEIVTQIIPIRFVTAGDLVKDLSSFVSPQATVVANEDGNSIVITDTQSNIRHLVTIIKAIDDSAEAETQIRVFKLHYANPSDVATELGNVFPNSTTGGTQAPTRFAGAAGGRGGGGGRGGFGGGGRGGFGAGGGNPFAAIFGGGNTANSSADRIQKQTQVTVVPDLRIQAVIVTAPKDLMSQIASMMDDLDVPSDRDQQVYVFKTENGDPQQMLQVLQNMFQSSSSSRGTTTGSSTTSMLQQRVQNATTQMGTSSSPSSSTGGTTGGGGGRAGGG
ncbi:MAG TPA: secretin N-terminal domain-containing protein [Verrucomicrobiae bacterium]